MIIPFPEVIHHPIDYACYVFAWISYLWMLYSLGDLLRLIAYNWWLRRRLAYLESLVKDDTDPGNTRKHKERTPD